MAVVKVQSSGPKLKQRVLSGEKGEFDIISDEPERLGGESAGPTPYDLLLGALGSCMSMTMLLYARRKAWPLESVELELTHSRVHAKDCMDCERKSIKLDRIDVTVALFGNLAAEQEERILAIGRRCPVHNTLINDIVIEVVSR